MTEPRFPCPSCNGPSIVEVTSIVRGRVHHRWRRHPCRNPSCKTRFSTHEPLAEVQS